MVKQRPLKGISLTVYAGLPSVYFEGYTMPDEYDADYEEYLDDLMEDDFHLDFQNPGGNSALRRATRDNPRNCACPTCKRPNTLTPHDVALGYQCDACADAQEGGAFFM